jgi:hypothetical protein
MGALLDWLLGRTDRDQEPPWISSRQPDADIDRTAIPIRMSGAAEAPRPRPPAAPVGDRRSRIVNEVMMIAPRFSEHEGVCYDEANADWLMIPKYPLPERFRARWCKLLVVFPEFYPVAPPIGFYLNRKFRLRTGGQDPHLVGFGAHSATDLREQGWFWYCVRTVGGPGGWKPSTDYRKPDNLWSLLALIREALTNDV